MRLLLLALAVATFSGPAQACFFDRAYPGAQDISEIASFFIADIVDYQIHFDEDLPYYALLELKNIELIAGEPLSDSGTFYVIEGTGDDLTDFIHRGRYILAIENTVPMYSRYADGKLTTLPLRQGEPNAKWIVNRPCYLPFVINYSESALRWVSEYIKRDYRTVDQ